MNTQTMTINTQKLQSMLAQGKPVTVLDVRHVADFNEWSIPNSLNLDVLDALQLNDARAMQGVNLYKGKPIVTVCASGNLSQLAAQQLRDRGYEALSLAGGMNAWSLAWNVADVPINIPDVQIIQVRRTGKGCLSYLIGSGGEAAVVDASLDPYVYLELAQQHGWKISHVLDTHVHADHLSRSRLLAQKADATFYLPAQDHVGFSYTAVYHNDTFTIGSTTIRALHTPGHTLESTSYLFADETSDNSALISGDTLFLTAVGRPDLKSTSAEAHYRAEMLYDSLQQIMKLPATTLILPGHTNEPIPFDGHAFTGTLSQVIRETAVLSLNKTDFVSHLLQRLPATPPNHTRIVAQNESGKLPSGDLTEWEAGANRCAI